MALHAGHISASADWNFKGIEWHVSSASYIFMATAHII